MVFVWKEAFGIFVFCPRVISTSINLLNAGYYTPIHIKSATCVHLCRII